MPSEEKEIDHNHTDEIICPHCGSEYNGSWERQNNEGAEECGECDGEFYWDRIIDVTYSTHKIFCKRDGHKWRKVHCTPEKEGKWCWRSCSECNKEERGFNPEWAV